MGSLSQPSGTSPFQRRRALHAGNFSGRRLHLFLTRPYQVVAFFPLVAAGAILTTFPFSHWTHGSRLSLLILVGVTLAASCARFAIGDRPPRWTLHVDVLVGVTLISVLSSIQPSAHVDFPVFYIWSVVFSTLYFRPLFSVVYLGAVGAAYSIVLTIGPRVDNPATAWMATVGSSAVLGAVTLSLVSTLQRASREDVLTGLANRRAWDARLDEELERARRNRTALSVALIDVDNFKAVNDRDGHPAGDRLLCQLADGWRDTIRGSGDFLARLGGDEFGLVVPGSNDTGIQRLVERLHEITPSRVSCSIGVATWDGTETAAVLFRRADVAMYEAKRELHAT